VELNILSSGGNDETFNSWINASDINMMDHFYVTLPSDSSGYFPRNKLSNFRTKLASPIELESDKWEVGVVEISYPKGSRKRMIHNTRRLVSMEIKFPVKHYESIRFNLKCNPIFKIM
jgi:hypothetical protein